MTDDARTFIDKLAAVDSRKLARWTADRAREVRTRVSWHAARLRMLAVDSLTLRGRLPPGSLAASAIRDAHLDDRFYLKQFARYGPIFKIFWRSGDLKVCIVGYPLGRRLLHQHRASLRPGAIDLTPLVPAEYLRAMDPAIHPHYRNLFVSTFRSDFVGALRSDLITGWAPEIRRLIRDELNELAEGSRTASQLAARLHEALDRIAARILLLVVLGIRQEASISTPLRAAYRRLGPDDYAAPVGPEQRAAFPVIRGFVMQVVEALRNGSGAEYGDSIISRLALAPEPAIDETVIGNAIYMVERGRHDLRDLLRWVVKHLSDHPAVVAELRDDASPQAARQRLAECCVMETLRLEQAELLVRKALAPFSFEGYHIPKGSWVCILMRETHRDPNVFPEPDRFRPQRFMERTYSLNEYAPFGLDEHQCIAHSMNVRVGSMFIEELVGGYAWTIAADGPRRFGQFHWQPSPSFAIDLRRVERTGAAPEHDVLA